MVGVEDTKLSQIPEPSVKSKPIQWYWDNLPAIAKINIDDMAVDSVKTPELQHIVLKDLSIERKLLKSLENRKNKLFLELRNYYLGYASQEVYKEKGTVDIKILKGDVELYITADDEMVAMNERIGAQEEKVAYITGVLSALNNRSFMINNALKDIALKNGLNV